VNVIPLLQIGQPFDIGAGKFSLVSSDALMPAADVNDIGLACNINREMPPSDLKNVNMCTFWSSMILQNGSPAS